MPTQDQIDEVLELLWVAEERGQTSRRALDFIISTQKRDNVLEEMIHLRLVERDDGTLRMSKEARERARFIVRNHRLAERLVHDVFKPSDEELEEVACRSEHVLLEGISSSICTLLGHPRECPHGLPMPPGTCCERAQLELESVVVPITVLRAGEVAFVAHISTERRDRLRKLLSFGLLPGSEILLHQRQPALVLKIGETSIALEPDVARDIFVRRRSSP